MDWPPEDAIGITLRIGDTAGTSYLTTESARELATRLRALQTAMGSTQFVAGELLHQSDQEPDVRATLALFGEQARTIIAAIDEWEQDERLPDDVAKLRTALARTGH